MSLTNRQLQILKDLMIKSAREGNLATAKMKKSMTTPGLTMMTVVEPCLMCMSACAWAEYKEITYIIPTKRYIDKIPWVAEITDVDKHKLASSFHTPFKLTHLAQFEEEFSQVFEKEMKQLLSEA